MFIDRQHGSKSQIKNDTQLNLKILDTRDQNVLEDDIRIYQHACSDIQHNQFKLISDCTTQVKYIGLIHYIIVSI